VQVWGAIGAVALAFILYVWGRWIAGPYFEEVPAGPSEQPGWMDTLQLIWQPLFCLVALGFLYKFLIVPWRRTGRMTTDGMLCIAFALLFFQDPLSSFTGHWFTYNTNLLQMGSWVSYIPGWMSYSEPGANAAEPLLFTGAVYIWWFFGMALIGCWVMRLASARWPRLGTPELVAICFVAMFLGDIVAEGVIFIQLGFLTYPGGHWNLFGAGTWHQYPIHEGLTAAALFTGLASLRYFRNDKGETFADRGIETLKLSTGRKQVLKLLALIGAAQVIMLVTYNIPVATLIASHPAEWPEGHQARTYFNNQICGEGTARLCPQQGLPTVGNNQIEIGPGGKLTVPEDVQVPPRFVPLTGVDP
jgi:hypothetical protein